MKKITISEILSLLDQGYTRLEKDATEANKSLQNFYELPASKIAEIFRHPKLRGKMTNYNSFELIDDTVEEDTTPGVIETVNNILA